MPITPLFAAIFAIIYVVLSFGVIKHRFAKQVSLGDGQDKQLQTAIRAHGNFAEYVPFALLLMWFLEIVAYEFTLVLILGTALLVARLAHVVGLRDPKKYIVLRQLGTMATFAVLLFSAGRLIWQYFPV